MRDTTPNLTALKKHNSGLIVFHNVLSTHTHTSSSLLEALSIAIAEDENVLPITERKRISIIDIFAKSGITPTLYSNQGQTGSWNLTSSIIFKNANRNFSINSKYVGNVDYRIKRPLDHEYFDSKVSGLFTREVSKRQLIFLHSYAGHGGNGGYLPYIPQSFHEHVDTRFKNLDPQAIVGRDIASESVEQYDSAIKYVDYAISKQIEQIETMSEPIVFIFFSDHGEAVYAGRGHDSARFIHEMARIPFVMYFNKSARTSYSALFKKYLHLASKKRTATLAQFPSTLFDLFGGKILENNVVKLTPIIGEEFIHPPIIVRRTTEGTTYIDVNINTKNSAERNPATFFKRNDEATDIFVASSNKKQSTTSVCYHGSNTIGKARRGSLIADCLEFDVVVDNKGEISVYHPGAEDVGLRLEAIASIAEANKLALLIDGKNIQAKTTCSSLSTALQSIHYKEKPILIEFPTDAYKNKSEISECAQNLQRKGYFTSYYVSTEKAINCSAALLKGRSFQSVSDCEKLKNDMTLAFESGLFTDFSFDYDGIRAIEEIDIAQRLKWNTWNVAPKSFGAIDANRFRMVILSNKDPNSL